ncbi:hypothetical protein EVAR_80327_1 [Eumeta japonica]|uniref:Uncharacterized protein n=1 Tax=Eumeta variegata TaxID=151549 RepID=A0A4C1WYD5_EUMVA|nr:hypothetical protein EVAR_80327_1 [Eumeta japonica]
MDACKEETNDHDFLDKVYVRKYIGGYVHQTETLGRRANRTMQNKRERCGLKEDVVTGVEGGALRWFGHPER